MNFQKIYSNATTPMIEESDEVKQQKQEVSESSESARLAIREWLGLQVTKVKLEGLKTERLELLDRIERLNSLAFTDEQRSQVSLLLKESETYNKVISYLCQNN